MLGLCLVVHSDRGSSLVFRYPLEESSETEPSHAREIRALVADAEAKLASESQSNPYDVALLKARAVALQKKTSATSVSVAPASSEVVYGFPPKDFARMFCVQKEMDKQILELVIGQYKFVAFPVYLPTQSAHEITYFNMVWVLAADKPARMYKDAAVKFAKAIEHEQIRCAFLSTEVQRMLKVRDEFMRNHPGASGSGWKNAVLTESLLAKHMMELQKGMSRAGEAFILLNDWISVHLSLAQSAERQFSSLPIRPYHTLMLIEDKHHLLQTLSTDASPLLREFVKQVEPRVSFDDLAKELDVSLNTLYRLAAHLVYWGKARLMNVLQRDNVYVVSPYMTGDLKDLQSMFLDKFHKPSFTLAEFLSAFSVHKSLADHMANVNRDALPGLDEVDDGDTISEEAEDVARGRTNANGAPESGSGSGTASVSSPVGGGGKDEEEAEEKKSSSGLTVNTGTTGGDREYKGRSNPPSPTASTHSNRSSRSSKTTKGRGGVSKRDRLPVLNAAEKRYLSSAASAGPYRPLLRNLIDYFRGRHSVEEIVWRENFSRSDISALVRAYPDVLVEAWHEAPSMEPHTGTERDETGALRDAASNFVPFQ